MSYWQTVEVEADSSADAGNKAFDEFDITKARIGVGVFDNEHDAEKDAKEYRFQTGNPAYVDKEHEEC